MEILIGLVVIFILLLCLGASVGLIASIALALVGLFIIFMTCFFIYAVIIMVCGERTIGTFIRSEKDGKGKIPYALYLIDDEEYKNMLPLEVMFQSKLYREDRKVKLILNKKRKRCFDNNAVICCILGIIVSLFLSAEMIILVFGNI